MRKKLSLLIWILRWLAIAPAAYIAFGLVIAIFAHGASLSSRILCSGDWNALAICTRSVLSYTFVLAGSATAAVCIIFISVILAPAYRRRLAVIVYGVGTLSALYLALSFANSGDFWFGLVSFIGAMVGGFIAVRAVTYFSLGLK